MYCGICGTKIPDGESVCPNCGAEAEARRADAQNTAQQTDGQPAQADGQSQQPPSPPMYGAQGYRQWNGQYPPPGMQGQPYAQQGYPQYGQPMYQPYYQPAYAAPQSKKNEPAVIIIIAIVALAMLGVLAAILVPSFVGFNTKTKLTRANMKAKTAYSALVDCASEEISLSGQSACMKAAEDAAEYGVIDCEKDKDVPGVVGRIARDVADSTDKPGMVIVIVDENAPGGFAVQWRETNSSRIIGQYPAVVTRNGYTAEKPVWGEFYQDSEIYGRYQSDPYPYGYQDSETAITSGALRIANGNAKTAYSATAEYLVDQEVKGVPFETAIDEIVGTYDCSQTGDSEFSEKLHRVMLDNGSDNGFVCVMEEEINGQKAFAIHWCASGIHGAADGNPVGQYPEPVPHGNAEDMIFGVYVHDFGMTES